MKAMRKRRLRAIGLVVLFAAFISTGAAFGQILSDEIGPGEYYQITSLVISGETTVQLEPGGSRQFYVLSRDRIRAGAFYKVNAPAVWTVTPDKGAKIDRNGLLTIDGTAEHGAAFTVTASVTVKEAWDEKGYTSRVEQKVVVFEKKVNPLIGFWKQTHIVPCGAKASEFDEIRELEFRADGSFSVTRKPFEVYKDYWGKYAFDLKKGSVGFEIERGNDLPTGTDLSGSFKIEGKKLLLDGISLGYSGMSDEICAMHFEKY